MQFNSAEELAAYHAEARQIELDRLNARTADQGHVMAGWMYAEDENGYDFLTNTCVNCKARVTCAVDGRGAKGTALAYPCLRPVLDLSLVAAPAPKLAPVVAKDPLRLPPQTLAGFAARLPA